MMEIEGNDAILGVASHIYHLSNEIRMIECKHRRRDNKSTLFILWQYRVALGASGRMVDVF